jgi:hypothetical protein
MTAKHADRGQQMPREEASNVTAKDQGEHTPRTVVWADDRPVPVGVTGGAR